MIRVIWKNNLPVINIKEFYKVRKEEQLFPTIYGRFSDYLIANYLTSSKSELKRKVNTVGWKSRKQKDKEVKEGGKIYILANKKDKSLYVGETGRSLQQRYPSSDTHDTIPNWDQYAVMSFHQIQLKKRDCLLKEF